MGYESGNIATFINSRLNISHFIPAIQREFVWSPEKIIRLFDSIMRGYPIGSFLFWEITPENKEQIDAYKFIQNHKEGIHCEKVETYGVLTLTFILDGQQRLTSFLIGLKGSFTIKKKYAHRSNPNAWRKCNLYLNLLKNPKKNNTEFEDSEDDNELGIKYEFRFLEHNPKNDKKHYWFKVGKILDFDSQDRFYEFRSNEKGKLPKGISENSKSIFERNIDCLYRAVWKDDVISYYTERNQDYDRVLDIFVRANESGTKLSKSDLLLSMVTAKWDELNARDEIHQFVDDINNNLTRKNDFNKDFIMKTCLVLCDLSVKYRVENFTNDNLKKIYNNWENIKKSIRECVDLVNYFGIDRENLTSANALIPIVYYLFKHSNLNIRSSSNTSASIIKSLHRWILAALINNVFSGQSDTVLSRTRDILKKFDNHMNFPSKEINKALIKFNKKTYFDEDTINNFLSIEYGKKETFLGLTMLYDEHNWGTIPHHQDHIISKNLFDKKIMNEMGFDRNKQEKYIQLKDSIANLELLTANENLEKYSKDFKEWVSTRDNNFKRKHLIPENPELLKFEHFEDFIIEREKLIRQRLISLFGKDNI